MYEFDARVLHRPGDAALRFLPEGPYPVGENRLSWVAIQHGPDATHGSLNLLDRHTGRSEHHPLAGRPGFAFPTDREGTFVVGLERTIRLIDPATGVEEALAGPVDEEVEGTILNDAVVVPGEGIVFGTKDLDFRDPKAALYFWRASDGNLVRLAGGQICSNGKAVTVLDGRTILLDIDSPTRTVVAYRFDPSAGTLGQPRIVVDLRHEEAFPDGMVLTPDGTGVVVALYHPGDPAAGEARWYGIDDGQLRGRWRTPGSPRVTCPVLLANYEGVEIVLTTAVEHLEPERLRTHPEAGSLFVAPTPFEAASPSPVFPIP